MLGSATHNHIHIPHHEEVIHITTLPSDHVFTHIDHHDLFTPPSTSAPNPQNVETSGCVRQPSSQGKRFRYEQTEQLHTTSWLPFFLLASRTQSLSKFCLWHMLDPARMKVDLAPHNLTSQKLLEERSTVCVVGSK